MMVKPDINKMLNEDVTRFSLVIATAKRARQLTDGSTQLVDGTYAKPVTVAANEIFENKISIIPGDEMVKRREEEERRIQEVIMATEAALSDGEAEAEVAEDAVETEE